MCVFSRCRELEEATELTGKIENYIERKLLVGTIGMFRKLVLGAIGSVGYKQVWRPVENLRSFMADRTKFEH